MTEAPTRREQILATAADLFAARGFHGVSVAELGAACGISGPALYKHFPSKQTMLAEMLTSISERLLAVGRERVDGAPDGPSALRGLVAWHVDFALEHRALIVVQDRDWASLPAEARDAVRTLQRAYVDLWADQLRRVRPELGDAAAHAAAQAVFGLLNSTPRAGHAIPDAELRALLADLAHRALGV